MKDDKKLSFSERHPKLNTALVCIFLIALLWGCGYLLMKIAVALLALAAKLSEVVSKMDVVVIVALITGTISILGIVLSSIVAKSLEYKRTRREYLTQKREEPYTAFVKMIYKVQQNTKDGFEYTHDEMVKDIMSFSEQITLWGSPKVVKLWVEFKQNALVDGKAFDNLLLTEKIMNEMRADLGMKRMGEGDLLAFFVNDIKEAIKANK